ncbi:glycosyltransferase family 2 protein [Pseudooceanicola pacificus]|nr:glycosyltransferase family 2 protein [Pseudooceanicola pacificus]
MTGSDGYRALRRKADMLRVRIKNRMQRRTRCYPHDLGLLAIMKNEAMNLDEWIRHHLWQGVDRIYLIDNGSTDDTAQVLAPWLASGRVSCISCPEPHGQWHHYRKAIRNFSIRAQCRWLMLADLDEFWFRPDGGTLPDLLADFDKFDLIYTNWSIFGSSGLRGHPDSIRRSLTLRRPGLGPHDSTKWILRTSSLHRTSQIGIHKVRGINSRRTVSDNERLRINHYIIQSEDYFRRVKMTRGSAALASRDSLRDMEYFRGIDVLCTEEDRLLADMLARQDPIRLSDRLRDRAPSDHPVPAV